MKRGTCVCACMRCAQGVERGTCARVRACVVRRAWSEVRVRVCVRALCAGREARYVCACACVRCAQVAERVRVCVRACVVRRVWSVVRVRVCMRAFCAGREARRAACARVRACVVRMA